MSLVDEPLVTGPPSAATRRDQVSDAVLLGDKAESARHLEPLHAGTFSSWSRRWAMLIAAAAASRGFW